MNLHLMHEAVVSEGQGQGPYTQQPSHGTRFEPVLSVLQSERSKPIGYRVSLELFPCL